MNVLFDVPSKKTPTKMKHWDASTYALKVVNSQSSPFHNVGVVMCAKEKYFILLFIITLQKHNLSDIIATGSSEDDVGSLISLSL